MWKDFFYYTKTERQGIIVLVVLIIGVYLFPAVHQKFTEPEEEVKPGEKEELEKEYARFTASLQEVKAEKSYKTTFSKPSYPERIIKLSAFDPNRADSTTFLSLGLPSWMIKNILHYRRKQGKFRRPEDFKKIYGLTEEKYQTLRPYIQIAEEAAQPPKDTLRLLIASTEKRDTLIKYQPGTIIDLNSADTTELKKIPGIGSAIARMIVNRRKLLGGFYRIEQLQEIRLKADQLRSWFSIDANQIQRIDLNKASLERMMHHPYINYYQAKVIVEYRKKKGKLRSLNQLALYEEFTPEDFERISPYVCCDI